MFVFLPRSLFGRTRAERTSSTTYVPASPLNKSSLDNGITKSTSIASVSYVFSGKNISKSCINWQNNAKINVSFQTLPSVKMAAFFRTAKRANKKPGHQSPLSRVLHSRSFHFLHSLSSHFLESLCNPCREERICFKKAVLSQSSSVVRGGVQDIYGP